MGLKVWFKQKVRELKCNHYWRLTKECTVRDWDSPYEYGYDWHREWVCDKCGKVSVTETHRPIPWYGQLLTEADIREGNGLEEKFKEASK